MEQLNLLTYKPPLPARNVDTSRKAAETLREASAGIRVKVLDAIRGRGERGATSKEIADITGFPYEAVQPRTSELKRLGLIVDSGQRRASRAQDKQAIVWKAV